MNFVYDQQIDGNVQHILILMNVDKIYINACLWVDALETVVNNWTYEVRI